MMTKATASALCAFIAASAAAQTLSTENVNIQIAGDYLNVSADLVLDSLRLKSNNQIFITPVVKNDAEMTDLPSVLVSGRNMHISYQRGLLKNFKEIKNHNIEKEAERTNGRPQSISYSTRIPLEPWMKGAGTRLTFVYDSCGCGSRFGQQIGEEYKVFHNPTREMVAAMITPEVTELPVSIHEGRARVQFEVDRTELHVDPYRCKNGQRIDNRDQIAMIDDSVRYALSDPNVEISRIDICGYASPESPYRHNDELATGRSRALSEYLADRYNLPRGSAHYSSVPENWGEFREQVLASNELTDAQRQLLLELIDAPAVTPEQFDEKERILKTDPRYRDLYQSKILPEWFPRLRATTFAIHTRLKPLPDEDLAKVIKTSPEKMSLNQMFRVARLYPEGSEEFNKVIETALRYYPNDQTAIVNAATAAVLEGEYQKASEILAKAQNSPEVYNLLGIIATSEDRYDDAERYFKLAGDLPAAVRNLDKLK